MKFVVSDRRSGTGFYAAPGFVITIIELFFRPGRVSVVADREDLAGNRLNKFCGRQGAREIRAVSNVARTDKNYGWIDFFLCLGRFRNRPRCEDNSHANQKTPSVL